MQHISFAESRNGLSDAKTAALAQVLVSLEPLTLHHGDCVGADARAHQIAEAAGWPTVTHPPLDESLRAFCRATETRHPMHYLVRNEDIVRESSQLVACPDGPEHDKSGTWSTVRYARRYQKPVTLVLPDGTVTHESPIIKDMESMLSYLISRRIELHIIPHPGATELRFTQPKPGDGARQVVGRLDIGGQRIPGAMLQELLAMLEKWNGDR